MRQGHGLKDLMPSTPTLSRPTNNMTNLIVRFKREMEPARIMTHPLYQRTRSTERFSSSPSSYKLSSILVIDTSWEASSRVSPLFFSIFILMATLSIESKLRSFDLWLKTQTMMLKTKHHQHTSIRLNQKTPQMKRDKR